MDEIFTVPDASFKERGTYVSTRWQKVYVIMYFLWLNQYYYYISPQSLQDGVVKLYTSGINKHLEWVKI